MTKYNSNRPNFKALPYDIDPKLLDQPIEQHFAAAGELNNDQIKKCSICRSNGWLREAITFEPNKGRVKSDGSNEINGWIVRDYFTGQIHQHKQPIEGRTG
jgi:hypothetical protein